MGLKELVVLRIAKRWIAGADLDSAVGDSKKANSKGYGVLVNFLGEEIKDQAKADAQVDEYLRLQKTLSDNGIRGCASVKLTQLGLTAGREGASARLEKIASNAEALNQFLWVDMEMSSVVDDTLSVYLEVLKKHPRVGLALQSYLRRSEADLKVLLNSGAKIRLVKGAYREPPSVIFPKEEVNKNFSKLMAMLFEQGGFFALGTHDPVLVDEAKKLAEKGKADFEFEMLKGIRDDMKEDLVKSGHKVSEYLPYGDQWWAYSKRRITEHPSNIWLLLRSLV